MTYDGSVNPDDLRLFAGSSNPALADALAAYLRVPRSPARSGHYSNDSLHVQLGETVRSRVVVIVQSFSPPVAEHAQELLLMLDAARSAGAKEVHAIIPYYSYARSDKKDAPRISIAGRLMARLMQTAGATNVMTMSLHSAQVHGFFDVPTDPLTARPVFEEYFRHLPLADTIVISPDAGRVHSAGRFAQRLNLPLAVGNKTRVSDTQVIVSGLIGDVSGKTQAIIYDDEIASGTSITEVSKVLRGLGIERFWVVCTHGVFAGDALARLSALPGVQEIIATDTVPIPANKRTDKLRMLSVAPLFGEAIRRNYLRQSIGDLFTFWNEYTVED
ncbi:MAG: ribose-phosphate pyrophosphokinase [Anaerolineales bacterium]|nr:ribose-phosphate pyrophosphokinase [Anaerolineales bacterium]